MFKYARTQHVEGSRKSLGDDLDDVPLLKILNKNLIIEEKMDGANSGISFEDGQLKLQSRGHYLRGGPREKHFDVFKQWANCQQVALYNVVGERYVMFGEWMYAKHTCFYDALPHYFMEFDILDKETGEYLSTPKRNELITGAGARDVITSVKVIKTGNVSNVKELNSLIAFSHFKTENWVKNLHAAATAAGVTVGDVDRHTDMSFLMEGLYIKHENDDSVLGRYKFVRQSFTNSILDQDEHWLNRRIIPNSLISGAWERMFE